MQSLMRYGWLAAVCGVLTSACGGDTSGERPTPGQPSSGNGGAAGSAGQTGAGTGGRGGGTAMGTGGTGSTPNTTFPPACAGCVELLVLISDSSTFKSVQYVIRPPAPGVDLSTAVVTWRVRALTPAAEIPGDQMYVTPFATNGAPGYLGAFGTQMALTAANGFTDSDTWVDVTLDFNRVGPTAPTAEAPPPAAGDAGVDGGTGTGPAPVPGGAFIVSMIDKTLVTQVGLQIGTIAAFTGTGVVRIAVDSVTVTGVDATVFASRTFDMALEGLTQNDYQVPPGTPMPVLRPQ